MQQEVQIVEVVQVAHYPGHGWQLAELPFAYNPAGQLRIQVLL